MATSQQTWQRITELFEQALEHPVEMRAQFLASACAGDASLKNEVESLLAEHEAGADFLESPAVASVANQISDENGNLRIGQHLGQYRIDALLGRGGMGEVYVAQDKLGRNIALKLLRQRFPGDKSGVARFQQEARTLLALNHPHIVTIHDIDQSEAVYYIASELVEGKTLRERLDEDDLKLEEVLEIAIQVTTALAAAHEKGIVHRDIKPENIMIRRDGFVKVLDFGIAKLADDDWTATPEAPPAKQSDTAAGTVVGTAPYMSPEQARGLNVDARTDIWSLGVVIYESIAGVKPFSGETTADVINSVIGKTPAPLTRHTSEAGGVERIVLRALRKEREARYQTANELLADLKRLRTQVELSKVSSDMTGGEVLFHLPRTSARETMVTRAASTYASSAEYIATEIKQHRLLFAACLLALLVGSVGLAVYFMTRQAGVTPVAPPFSEINISRLTTSGKITHSAISADGRYVANVVKDAAGNSIWLKQVSAPSNVRVAGPVVTEYISVAFTPDSNSIYYIALDHDRGESTLYRAPVPDGVTETVANDIYPVGFSPDGKQIAFIRFRASESHLVVADAAGTNQRVVATRHKPDFFELEWNAPAWSPDGKTITCPIRLNDQRGHYDTLLNVNVADGMQTPLGKERWNYVGQSVWLHDGSGLLLTASDRPGAPTQVWHLRLQDGVATRITHDLNNYHDLSLTVNASRLVAVQTQNESNIWVAPKVDARSAKQISADIGSLETLAWTHDGQIVYRSNAGGEGSDIWIMKADGSNARQLTWGARVARGLTICPDTGHIIFSSDMAGQFNLWRVDIDGANLSQLTHGDGEFYPQCTPDGRWVVYQSNEVIDPRLWKVPADGGQSVLLTNTRAMKPAISPDGQMIAFSYLDINLEPSRWGIGIISSAGGERLKRFDFPTTVVYRSVRWSPDGQSVAFVNNPGGRSDIWLQPLSGSAPKPLTKLKAEQILGFDWSPDGHSLAFVSSVETSDVVLIDQGQQ
ncbi:MAG TPA: protein kinase [Pyrinomonadaceae bacterium]